MTIDIRVHLNKEKAEGGTLWWAEGGDYVGGNDELDELIGDVREWVEDEGLKASFQLVGETTSQSSNPLRVSVEPKGFESVPANERIGSGKFVTYGVPA